MSDEVNLIIHIKQATKVKSRENAKKVKSYHAANWGDYNVNFLVPSTGGV